MIRVYLVEDNPDNADLIMDFLIEDYEIKWFKSGSPLLDFLEKPDINPPDIFLLDIGLPVMNGEEILKKLRNNEIYKNVPAIALTAHAMKGDKQHFLDVGFDGYVSKPMIDETELIDEIGRLTNKD